MGALVGKGSGVMVSALGNHRRRCSMVEVTDPDHPHECPGTQMVAPSPSPLGRGTAWRALAPW